MAIDIPAGLQAYLPPSYVQNGELTVSKETAIEVASGIQARVKDMPPAEAKAFMERLNGSADLAPSSGLTPDQAEAALDKFEAVFSALQGLVSSSNTMDFLAKAMIEHTAQQRKNQVEEGTTARQIAKAELLAQAGKMEDAAKDLRSGAVSALIVSCVMAAVSLVGSAISIGSSFGSLSKMKDAVGVAKEGLQTMKMADQATKIAGRAAGADGAKILGQAKELQAQSSSMIQAAGVMSQGATASKMAKMGEAAATGAQQANTFGQSLSGYFNTMSQADAKSHEAEGQEAAASSQEYSAKADVKKEAQQALDDMIKNIINFLKEMSDQQANRMAALTRV